MQAGTLSRLLRCCCDRMNVLCCVFPLLTLHRVTHCMVSRSAQLRSVSLLAHLAPLAPPAVSFLHLRLQHIMTAAPAAQLCCNQLLLRA